MTKLCTLTKDKPVMIILLHIDNIFHKSWVLWWALKHRPGGNALCWIMRKIATFYQTTVILLPCLMMTSCVGLVYQCCIWTEISHASEYFIHGGMYDCRPKITELWEMLYWYYNSRVSCQKGPICHVWAWRVAPFWQDTIELWFIVC